MRASVIPVNHISHSVKHSSLQLWEGGTCGSDEPERATTNRHDAGPGSSKRAEQIRRSGTFVLTVPWQSHLSNLIVRACKRANIVGDLCGVSNPSSSHRCASSLLSLLEAKAKAKAQCTTQMEIVAYRAFSVHASDGTLAKSPRVVAGCFITEGQASTLPRGLSNKFFPLFRSVWLVLYHSSGYVPKNASHEEV